MEVGNSNLLDKGETSDVTSTDESHLHQLHNRELEIDDISDLPLPELPPKKNRKSSSSVTAATKPTESTVTTNNINPEHQPAAATTEPKNSNDEIPPSQPPIQDDEAKVKKQQRRLSLENSNKKFQEHLDKIEAKLNAKKMHYYNMNYGGNGHVPILSNNHHHNNNNNNTNGNHSKPTYLFGCNQPASGGGAATAKKNHSNDEIFLNTSGWVQVNTKRRSPNSDHKLNNGGNAYKNTIRVIEIANTQGQRGGKSQPQQNQVYSIPKLTASKIEELISRNEARRYHQTGGSSRNYSFKPGYKILDPHISAMLNDRPGFLPVKNFKQSNSPPPMTPILSPPPAFQDNTARIKTKTKNFRDSSEECEVCIASAAAATNNSGAAHSQSNKGMVFSRSFEYDNRRIPNESYVDTFSRSFDCNLSDNPPKMTLKNPSVPVVTSPRRIHRERSPNFRANSTTVPNTSTTTHTSSSSVVAAAIRDNSPKQNKDSSPIYMVPNGKRLEKSKSTHDRSSRLRKNQLTKLNSHHHDRPQPQHIAHYPQVSSVSRFRSFDAGNQRLNSCDSGARSGE